jgi:hypothetical protein
MRKPAWIIQWLRHYDPKRFGCDVLDGTQWSVSASGIRFSRGKELSSVQQEYLVDVIMTWIEKEYKASREAN